MRTCILEITALENLAFSATSATTSMGAGLDFVPGSKLLGAAARTLYGRVEREEAFRIFHSGQVRFGNGMPLTEDGVPTVPVPLSLYSDKHGRPPVRDGRMDPAAVVNLPLGRLPVTARLEPVEAGYLAADGSVTRVLQDAVTRTAGNAATQFNRDGGLFTIREIVAGQRFIAPLEADADLPEHIWERLVAAFSGTRISIGRSRRTELGSARCEIVSDSILVDRPRAGPRETLTLLALSDVLAVDASGTPTFAPRLDELHPDLPSVELAKEKSFIRTRRWSPYNDFLQSFEIERPVIMAGSVLRYDVQLDARAAQLLLTGVGLCREGGLGRVWPDPPLLSEAHPRFSADVARRPRTVSAGLPSSLPASCAADLVAWARRGRRRPALQRSAKCEGAKAWGELQQIYRLGHVRSDGAFGPGASQWGRVGEVAARPELPIEDLRKLLFDEERGICRLGDASWGQTVRRGGEAISISASLRTLILRWEEEWGQEDRGASLVRLALRSLASWAQANVAGDRRRSSEQDR